MSSSAAAASGLEIGAPVGRLELEGAWAIDPAAGREGPADLVVEGGTLAALTWRDDEATSGADRTGPPAGIVVAPGFVDLHAHFREPGFEDAETVATGQAAAAHGGFTTVCVMPNTDPPLDEAPALRAVLARAGESGSPVRVLAWGAATRRREGKQLAQLGELADAGAPGYSDDGSPIAGHLFGNVLAYAGMLGRIVVDHAEDRDLTAGAEANEGLVATVLGLRGWPAAAEESAVARDIAVLADVLAAGAPARLHLTHVSTGGAIEQIRRAKAAGLPVTCDVTPHHLALTDEWLAGARRWAWEVPKAETAGDGGDGGPWAPGAISGPPFDPSLRVNPPLRTPADARAILDGLLDGTVDAVATDHAPHTHVDKEVEFGLAANGISGIETALGILLAAVGAGELPLRRAIEALTVGPASVLAHGAPPGSDPSSGPSSGPLSGPVVRPALAVGRPADLVVFDLAEDWLVSESSLASRGKNSPLLGRTLPGRVLATVAGGRLAHVDPELG